MLLHLRGVEGQLDGVDAFGQTPLHLASLRGNVETVRFLMEEAAAASIGGVETEGSGRIGSKMSAKSLHSFPAKLLTMTDKENKTALDLAVKKKKLGCELLLTEYHEQYVAPKRGFFSGVGQIIKDIFSIKSWKAWMGMTGSELPIGQNPTFPFYWMIAHILMAGIFYCTEFIGIGPNRNYETEGLLWDKLGLHFFFITTWIFTWITLYYTFRTNPGVLDARGVGNSSTTPTCQLLCCNGGSGYPRDKISLEMDSVTKELRNQYDAVIGKQIMTFCLLWITSFLTDHFFQSLKNHSARTFRLKTSEFHCVIHVVLSNLFDQSTVGLLGDVSFYLTIIARLLALPLACTTTFTSTCF